jgi:hypothetical protein
MTEEALARAEAQVEAGDLDGARATAAAILAAEPQHAGAHNVLGFIAHREGRLADALVEFAQAGDDPDALANLEAVEAELRRTAAPPPPSPTFGFSYEDLRRGALGPGLSPTLLGQLLALKLEGDLETRVTQLPSAASANERRFLLRFAQHLWDGKGDVFENGPLLGGTTRGLALGMLANPRRRPGALLHTFDWFAADEGDLPPVWEQFIAAGMIKRSDYKEMQRSGSFQKVFDILHSGHDYSPLMRSHEAYLPGHRDEPSPGGRRLFEVPEGREFAIVFVDGCKSWYGTKYWAERISDHVRPGSHFVFQDYGWYTCFWLPVFVSVLEDHFRFVTHVDDTYAFELVRPLEREIVSRRFPDEPTDLERDAHDDIFLRLGMDAGVRGDVHAMVSLTIQHAAAMAYLGQKDEARAHISAMLGRPEFFQYRKRMIERAIRSPTYTPEGPVLL